MAPQPSLDAQEIADKAKRDLLNILEAIRGKKNLVLERPLAGPLGLCVKFSTLQEYGVDRVFFIENGNVDSSQRNVVFLARGDKASNVRSIAAQINRLRVDSDVDHEFTIIWVPRRTLISDQILEAQGVLGDVNVHVYPLFFIPLADDLLSLELDSAFGDLYLKKDPTCINLAARALMLIQQKHGLFPRIIGKGDKAKRLASSLLRMRKELIAGGSSANSSFSELAPSQSIESLIIIDREVDLPTVLLTQLTYEGLLDEFFGVSSNQIEVDAATVGGTSQTAQASTSSTPQNQSLKRKILLDGSEPLYRTLRDSNCAVVGPLLNKVARRLQETYDSRNSAKSTAELREFVAKLPGYQAEQASLKLHTNLAEEVIRRTKAEFFNRALEIQQNITAGADPATQHSSLDELIARDAPLPTVLRLLAIYSTFNNGLRARDLDSFRLAVVRAYGQQHLLTLQNLEAMGLLTARAGGGALAGVGVGPAAGPPGRTTNYAAARRSLHLIVDEVNEAEPDDAAYAFSGYAPLSVRLVQCVLQKQYMAALTAQGGAAGGPGGSGGGGGGAGGAVAAAAAAAAAAGPTAGLGWRPFEDAVKQVRGETFDEAQTGEEKAVRARQMLNGSSGSGASADAAVGKKTVVVFFLGGVCRAEIAALRFVARRLGEEARGKRIVIATTNVLSGDGVVGTAIKERSFRA